MNKIKKIISLTILIITTPLVAQECYQEECYLTECPTPCCYDSCGCGAFFLDARLLYLRAFEGGLTSACDSTQTINTNENGVVVSRLEGKSRDLDFKWNAGFRLGAGYEFANRDSYIGAYWTHYNSHASRGSGQNSQHWKINYNVVDLLYAYEYNLSHCFTLIPFGGLRYAEIDQHIHTHFVSTENGIANLSQGRAKENFQGIGPLFGLEGDLGIGCGFSLYGNVAASILYGKFHVRSNSIGEFDTGINRDHLRKNLHACQPVIDLGFGVRWKTCFCCDKLLILQLGLEEHRYFNHNQFCDYGDLSLDGVSFAISVLY